MMYVYALAAAGTFFLIGKSRPGLSLASAAITAIGFYLYLRAGVDHSNWYFMSPLYIIMEAYLLWKSRGSWRFVAIMALMATIFGGLGSNIIFARVVLFPTMPIVIYLAVANISSRAKAAAFAAIWIPLIIINIERLYCMLKEWNECPMQPPYELQGVPHMKKMYIGWWDFDRIQRIADRFMPYATDTTYNTAVMRSTPDDFMFEYMFDSRSPVYSHHWEWTDTLMITKDYTDKFNNWLETLECPVAVLMVRHVDKLDCPEEEIISEYKRRYRTVYSDSTFTIVIKDAD